MNILNNYKKIDFFAKNKKNKILIIGGQKSYHKSGANLFFKKLLKNNKVEYYFKNSAYPEIKEVEIIAKIIAKINSPPFARATRTTPCTSCSLF